ncbi:hypothetical protein NC653_036527 [Populus alba x Populus x berolinensis]|uniref:Uncharacterized protein n=1 Tax=Populus alba x Populus x berolinensis TaxID=444605 RepID=A0AAD6LMP4_9ROSI|nr:hypothetical protein NC653_036527 [Populus alba x Populus x berolinensis]
MQPDHLSINMTRNRLRLVSSETFIKLMQKEFEIVVVLTAGDIKYELEFDSICLEYGQAFVKPARVKKEKKKLNPYDYNGQME